MCLCTDFNYPEVTLCGWQDIKIRLLTTWLWSPLSLPWVHYFLLGLRGEIVFLRAQEAVQEWLCSSFFKTCSVRSSAWEMFYLSSWYEQYSNVCLVFLSPKCLRTVMVFIYLMIFVVVILFCCVLSPLLCCIV